MRVLIACESSGIVREAFRARGHDAWSCDLLPAQDGSPFHLTGDVVPHLGNDWDIMIAHPPCTYLAVSGLHWNARRPGRAALTEDALRFVLTLMNAPVPRIAIENPVGAISTRIRKPDQYIQPYQFGHAESKKTGLWLKNLSPLSPTSMAEPPAYQTNGRPRWNNQTASGQNRLSPGPNRWQLRSQTYAGIADAMAAQWG